MGAGNKLEIFALDGSANFNTTSAFVFDKNVSFNITGHPKKQNLVIEMDSKIDDEDYGEFLSTYLSSTPVESQEVEYVDSERDMLISGLDKSVPFGYVWYGARDANNKIKVIVGRGILTGDTGNASYQAKNVGNYPVQITTVPNLQVTCPLACLDATRIETPVQIVVAATEYGVIRYFEGT